MQTGMEKKKVARISNFLMYFRDVNCSKLTTKSMRHTTIFRPMENKWKATLHATGCAMHQRAIVIIFFLSLYHTLSDPVVDTIFSRNEEELDNSLSMQ